MKHNPDSEDFLIPQFVPDWNLYQSGSHYKIINETLGSKLNCNQSTCEICNYFPHKATVAQIAMGLSERHEIQYSEMRSDVLEALDKLEDLEIIEFQSLAPRYRYPIETRPKISASLEIVLICSEDMEFNLALASEVTRQMQEQQISSCLTISDSTEQPQSLFEFAQQYENCRYRSTHNTLGLADSLLAFWESDAEAVVILYADQIAGVESIPDWWGALDTGHPLSIITFPVSESEKPDPYDSPLAGVFSGRFNWPASFLPGWSQQLTLDRIKEFGQSNGYHIESYSCSSSNRLQAAGHSPPVAKARTLYDFFDAIFCINLESQTDKWQEVTERFSNQGIADRVIRFPAVVTPMDHHVGCTLSHRQIVHLADRCRMENVLVFEDDVLFLDTLHEHLNHSLAELQTTQWKLFYLGGCQRKPMDREIEGYENLKNAEFLTTTHAIAYHQRSYEQILADIPDNLPNLIRWRKKYAAIDQYLTFFLGQKYLASPTLCCQPQTIQWEDPKLQDRYL